MVLVKQGDLLYSLNAIKVENFGGMFNNSHQISKWATFELHEERSGTGAHAVWHSKHRLQSNSTKPRFFSNDSFQFTDI